MDSDPCRSAKVVPARHNATSQRTMCATTPHGAHCYHHLNHGTYPVTTAYVCMRDKAGRLVAVPQSLSILRSTNGGLVHERGGRDGASYVPGTLF